MNQVSVLLISPCSEFIAGLQQHLAQSAIRTCQVERWEQIPIWMESEQPQLIVLDCPGSGVDGLSLCREIRSAYKGLLLLVIGENEVQLQGLALDMGADVCLSSSAGLLLIVAQIKALLRRFSSPAIQIFGSLTVDATKLEVFVAEQPARLTTIEFNLIWLLVKKAGSVVSRDDIHHALYNSSFNGYDRGIDLCVSRIRQKIGDDPLRPRYLKTVRGVGYQFVAAN